MRISDWSSDVCSSDLFGQDRQPRLLALIRLQEMLRLENGGIPMRQAGRKPAVVALLAPWEINQHHPRRLRHRHRTEKALDQLQAQIGPGHQPSSEERSVGKECVSTFSSRGSPDL